jgi:hypothetical protein
VNTGEDRPKIFPVEIMPLEDAPKKYTKQVLLKLQSAHLQPKDVDDAFAMVSAQPGRCPLFLCFRQPGGETVIVEAHERYFVAPSQKLQQDFDGRFGEGSYFAKVDTSLPERPRRNWEKKSDNGGGED